MKIGNNTNIGFKGCYFVRTVNNNAGAAELLKERAEENITNPLLLGTFNLTREATKDVYIYHTAQEKEDEGAMSFSPTKTHGIMVNTPNPQYSSRDKMILNTLVTGSSQSQEYYKRISETFDDYAFKKGNI